MDRIVRGRPASRRTRPPGRPVAGAFIRWLEVPPRRRWLDVGCGTGALTEVVVEVGEARSVVGVDPSAGFVQHARTRSFGTAEVQFLQGDALALPVGSVDFDVVVSGLVLNFVPEPGRMVAEMTRAGMPGGTVALYVWDMSGGMELLARFWEAATEVDPSAATRDEAARFREIRAGAAGGALRRCRSVGRRHPAHRHPHRVPRLRRLLGPHSSADRGRRRRTSCRFRHRQEAIREALRSRLKPSADGSLRLNARAWAIRGTKSA